MERNVDISFLEAALIGYEAELAKIDSAIADIQKRLGHKRTVAFSAGDVTGPFLKGRSRNKHHISAEGRATIAAAQRKRWSDAKKGK